MPESSGTDISLIGLEFDPEGSITSPTGFTAGVAAYGLKAAGSLDLALNRISLDGDSSTNDTVLSLANGVKL